MLFLSVTAGTHVTGVERFPASADLARRNIPMNGLEDRFDFIEGDLRDSAFFGELGHFDLVIGAPPFRSIRSGSMPKDPQRRVGRFEFHGGVEDYFDRAQRCLTPDGHAVILMDGRQARRSLIAAERAGLFPKRLLKISSIPGSPPVFSICIAGQAPGLLEHDSWNMIATDEPGDTSPSASYLEVADRLDLPWKSSKFKVNKPRDE